MEIELVTFKICPFGQRPLITMRRKGVPHTLTYITPDTLPSWFAEVSPFGKVPLLRVGDTTLFESAVIGEYVDEISGEPLMPRDPLLRAMNRAWIEFASACLGDMHGAATAAGEEEHLRARDALVKKLGWLERRIGPGPYFNGAAFSLVDSAFGPLFQRLDFLQAAHRFLPWEELPQVRRYADALLALEEVTGAVPAEFPQLYRGYLGRQGAYGAALFAK